MLALADLNLQLVAMKTLASLYVNGLELEVEPHVRRAQKLIIILGALSFIVSIALLTWFTFVLLPPGS